jgi:hypothetical protein
VRHTFTSGKDLPSNVRGLNLEKRNTMFGDLKGEIDPGAVLSPVEARSRKISEDFANKRSPKVFGSNEKRRRMTTNMQSTEFYADIYGRKNSRDALSRIIDNAESVNSQKTVSASSSNSDDVDDLYKKKGSESSSDEGRGPVLKLSSKQL